MEKTQKAPFRAQAHAKPRLPITVPSGRKDRGELDSMPRLTGFGNQQILLALIPFKLSKKFYSI